MLWSLPLWERGLKSGSIRKFRHEHEVAPLVGAWIEISHTSTTGQTLSRRSPCGSVD